MRKLCWIGLLCLAGCQTVQNPFGPKKIEKADDPLLAPVEQQRKARYLHAFAEEELGPRPNGERAPLYPHGQ
jgi:hypothetical protein